MSGDSLMVVILESPTLLQSSLAHAPLADDADASWKFMVACGALPPYAEQCFREVLAEEAARGEITGPQLSLRVALGVEHLATADGRALDVGGVRARACWDAAYRA